MNIETVDQPINVSSRVSMQTSVLQTTTKTTAKHLSFLNPMFLGRVAMSTLFDSPPPSGWNSGLSHHKGKPSQFVIDDEGLKWRLCAGAAVFNSRNEVLVAERIGKPGSWQAPQGGVDAISNFQYSRTPETVTEAAVRELYEEVGLKNGNQVLIEQIGDDVGPIKCRYSTKGTGSWLEKEGYAGQELNWVIFRCADAMLERNPSLLCQLKGMNGEAPEFSAVKWENLDWVVDNVWKNKVRPYQVLRDASRRIIKQWDERCKAIDFTGQWARDSSRSIGVVEGLVSRGIGDEKAMEKATEPYIQFWKRATTDDREWVVTTYEADGTKPKRELHYPLGNFEEAYEGKSTLFGGNDGGVVSRHCFYLAESDSDDKIAHVTFSETPRGEELAARYMKNGELILRRTFWHSWGSNKVESTEVFTRC
mmetsp:Transcript_11333/g.23569  ORF Transcript_11333/g.23569 Transcript_11333/m.23569 type:complete len:421 (+) Transcript_11333:26-1288(+)